MLHSKIIRLPTQNLKSNQTRWVLTALTLLAWLVMLPGIQRDLPYANDFDEPEFVVRAVQMAAAGSLNPKWFGHPGSTVFTPLTALYHTWFAVTQQGHLLAPNPALQVQFDDDHAWEYYLLGRLLAVTYHVLSVPLLYCLGMRAFGRRTALAGALLYVFFPTTVFYARMVRSDSAATFFGLLCLWRCAHIHKNPALRNQLLAGAALGLAVASRYFMATLIFVYGGVNLLHFIKATGSPQRRKLIHSIAAGGTAVLLAFALVTPYFFLDFGTVLADFQVESRTEHLGFDGLTPAGNLWFYLSTGIPRVMTWVPALFALVGVTFVIFGHRTFPKLLVGYAILFLVSISLPALHWPRWTLQILPVLALFAAHATNQIVTAITTGRYITHIQRVGYLSGALLITLLPLYKTLLLDIKWSRFSTRVDAATWIATHIPPGSLVALEIFQMDVSAPNSEIQAWGFLAEMGLSPAELVDKGYDYAVTNEDRYGRYFTERERYPEAVAFYEALFEEAQLVAEFPSSPTKAGPPIRVYALEP